MKQIKSKSAFKSRKVKENVADRIQWVHKLEMSYQRENIGVAYLDGRLVDVVHHEGEAPQWEEISLRDSVVRYKKLLIAMDVTGNALKLGPSIDRWLDSIASSLEAA